MYWISYCLFVKKILNIYTRLRNQNNIFQLAILNEILDCDTILHTLAHCRMPYMEYIRIDVLSIAVGRHHFQWLHMSNPETGVQCRTIVNLLLLMPQRFGDGRGGPSAISVRCACTATPLTLSGGVYLAWAFTWRTRLAISLIGLDPRRFSIAAASYAVRFVPWRTRAIARATLGHVARPC